MTFSEQVCHSYRCPTRWYEPFGESLSRLKIDGNTMSEFYTFELVIRLSKVKQPAFFQVSPVDVDVLNNWPLHVASPFSEMKGFVACCHVNNLSFLKRQPFRSHFRMISQATGHPCRFGVSFFLWSLVRFNCARNSFEH